MRCYVARTACIREHIISRRHATYVHRYVCTRSCTRMPDYTCYRCLRTSKCNNYQQLCECAWVCVYIYTYGKGFNLNPSPRGLGRLGAGRSPLPYLGSIHRAPGSIYIYTHAHSYTSVTKKCLLYIIFIYDYNYIHIQIDCLCIWYIYT